MNMKRNQLFVLLTTLCLTIGSAYAAPECPLYSPPEPGTYELTVTVNDALMGSATGSGFYADATNVIIEATPNSGYQFVEWNDGITTNPRTVTISRDSTFTATFEVIPCSFAGNCGASGDNLTWALSCEGELTITGSGAMADYADEASVPWYAHRGAVVSLSLPAGITTIGAYAFCATNVREVSLPEGVLTLGANAFMQCQSLRTLELPTTLTSIGANALAYCGALERIDCNATTPPTLAATAFTGDCYKTIHVPCPALEDYQTALVWMDLDQIYPQTVVVISYSITSADPAKGSAGASSITEYCDRVELTATATPNPGYEFVKWSDENTETPRAMVLYSDLVLTAIFQVEVDPGNLNVCINGSSVTVNNSPYAADIVIHDKTNAHTTSVPRTKSPQTIDIPAEWPAGDYIFEFDEGNRAFIVTKK